jgi:integrase
VELDRPPAPPCIHVWRSVRAGGDTKTKKSRRTLALPLRGTDALTCHKTQQEHARQQAGQMWRDTGLVFTSSVGTALDAANVRRAFRRVAKSAGLAHTEWTPRELRHSFVSLLSDSGMRLEDIAELCGHAGDGSRLPSPTAPDAAQRRNGYGADLRRWEGRRSRVTA